MPYIRQILRDQLDNDRAPAVMPGELNYQITKLVVKFLGKDPGYCAINDAIGALECAKLELYRRVAAPYESLKRDENGDVY